MLRLRSRFCGRFTPNGLRVRAAIEATSVVIVARSPEPTSRIPKPPAAEGAATS